MLYSKIGVRNSFYELKVVCIKDAYDSENVLFSDCKIHLRPDRVVLLLDCLVFICAGKCPSKIVSIPSHESERVFLCLQ